MQRVIKRDGREVDFDKAKIIKAISCANQEILKSKQIGPRKINQLATIVEEKCSEYKRAICVDLSVEPSYPSITNACPG